MASRPLARTKAVPQEPPPEEIWLREFVAFYGTENVTRVATSRLHGVSVTRAAEAIARGSVVSSEKSDGQGCVCRVQHLSDDDFVEVEVRFNAGTMMLEICGACVLEEQDGESDAA